MKIAVNTRLLLPDRLEGIGWFTYETLRRITASHPEHEFIFIFDRKPHPQFIFGPNVKPVVAYPQARHPILWYLFFEWGVARVLRKHKPHLFLSPDGWLSLRARTPSVAVIHDLNFEANPQWIPRHIASYYHYFFPRFARKAVRIATVSQYTRSDLQQRYGIDPARVDVVYNGANTRFAPLTPDEQARVRNQYSGGAPYFLFVGLIHPRKNLENQLRAFHLFKEKHGTDMKFLIVGAAHWWNSELEDLTRRAPHAADVVLLGRQGVENLSKLYGAAFALCYVSRFEGFGIPLLEAMHAEIPIITGSNSSLPEICAGAGLTAQADDPQDIARCMEVLYSDSTLVASLVAAGRKRREDFSWDRTAAALWESMMRAATEAGVA
jgi:glycosyltransferase involved in cell wall biosynthesis